MSLLPTFTRPSFLFFLLLVPPLIVWWFRQGRPSLRFSDIRLVTDIEASRTGSPKWLGLVLRTIALILLIIALAGPRWPDLTTRIPARGINIAIVVDVSRSMAESDFSWEGKTVTRLDAAKRAFALFVKGGGASSGAELTGRPNDRIALVAFSTFPRTVHPLTMDHESLLKGLEDLKPNIEGIQTTTNSGDAIAWGLRRLADKTGRRGVLIFLSDGEHNVAPPALKPRQAAQLAGNMSIPIYAIDATPQATGENKEEIERARKSLQQIAEISNGSYFAANDMDALVEVCKEIDQLERQENLTHRYRRYFEGFYWFASASLLLWLLTFVLETTWLRTLP